MDKTELWKAECKRIQAINAQRTKEAGGKYADGFENWDHEPMPPAPAPDAVQAVALVDAQDVKALAKEYTARAVDLLWEIAGDDDNPASARVAAATALLDRGHGKPAAVDEQEGELKRKRLSLEELLELRRALLALPDKQPVIIDQT